MRSKKEREDLCESMAASSWPAEGGSSFPRRSKFFTPPSRFGSDKAHKPSNPILLPHKWREVREVLCCRASERWKAPSVWMADEMRESSLRRMLVNFKASARACAPRGPMGFRERSSV